MIFGKNGNLYGTTWAGSTYGYGTVYELISHDGGWTEKVLYNFIGGTDGSNPFAGLVVDAAGNLYGTAATGGAHQNGVVFEITP